MNFRKQESRQYNFDAILKTALILSCKKINMTVISTKAAHLGNGDKNKMRLIITLRAADVKGKE